MVLGIVCTSWGGGGAGGEKSPPENFFRIFPPLGLKCEHFLKQIFWIYSVTLFFDRPNLIS